MDPKCHSLGCGLSLMEGWLQCLKLCWQAMGKDTAQDTSQDFIGLNGSSGSIVRAGYHFSIVEMCTLCDYHWLPWEDSIHKETNPKRTQPLTTTTTWATEAHTGTKTMMKGEVARVVPYAWTPALRRLRQELSGSWPTWSTLWDQKDNEFNVD